MKGLPTGYNKDLQEDKEPLFDSEDTLAVSLDATAAVIGNLTLHPDRTGRAAAGPAAGDRRGRLPRVARHAVPPGARSGRRDGAPAAGAKDATSNRCRSTNGAQSSELFGDDVKQHVTAAASVRVRKTPQSTHPDAVGAALEETRGWLARGTGV